MINYKRLFIFTAILLTFNLVLSKVIKFNMTPKQVYIVHSGIKEIDNTLNELDILCDKCLFKNGTYRVKINPVKFDDNSLLGLAKPNALFCNIDLSEEYKNWSKLRLTSIILHEIAHCMGYDHDSGPYGVMAPYNMDDVSAASLYSFAYFLNEISERSKTGEDKP